MAKKKVMIKVDDVSILFNLGKDKVDNLKEWIFKKLKGDKAMNNEFWGLKNVSFELKKGERLGILGLNGAGKSTLLKAIAGVYKPTTGNITRYGTMAPMIELGAGFDPNYTGRENIYLYGAVLGFDRKFMDSKFDDILAFSELGDFIDVPIKNYSSGMKARLGFSVATIVEPDILILDEVLAVGDAKFRKKCEARMQRMFDNGATVIFVSHSLAQMRRLCDKAILLDKGQLLKYGDIDEVADYYKVFKLEEKLAAAEEDEDFEKVERLEQRLARRLERQANRDNEDQDEPMTEEELREKKKKRKKKRKKRLRRQGI